MDKFLEGGKGGKGRVGGRGVPGAGSGSGVRGLFSCLRGGCGGIGRGSMG